MKNIIIYTFFSSCFFLQCNAQFKKKSKNEIQILSLENEKKELSINLNYANEKIEIHLGQSDSLCIQKFKDLTEEIKVINEKFIVIHYKTSGGSGVKNQKIILACVSNNDLFVTLDIFSLNSSNFSLTYNPALDSLNLYDESIKDSLDISSFEKENTNYKINIVEFYESMSKNDKTQNFKMKDSFELIFSSQFKAFYNEIDTLKGQYNVIDNTRNIDSQELFINEACPTIKFINDKYYFVNHTWYLKGSNNNLIKFSY